MIKQISHEELYEKIQKGEKLSLIDVREDEEVAEGIIPGAKHIPLGQIEDRMNEIDKNEGHILICRSGGRSGRACEFLNHHGFDVTNLVGGMIAWDAKYKK